MRQQRRWVSGFIAMAIVMAVQAPAIADSIRDRQWYLSALKAAQAHALTSGARVLVAVVDTGVDSTQQDLAGAVVKGVDLYPTKKGDGSGRYDLDGHGTEMAAIIAARGHGTSAGVLGIAPAAQILPIRVMNDFFVQSDLVAKGIDFAVEHHARVINLSFGGAEDTMIRDAIRRAIAADVVVVASSGNKDTPSGNFPGEYPEVLTVGAEEMDGSVAPISVTGPQVDLVAPGVDIATVGIFSKSGYRSVTGTSGAAAVVSGAAALVRARFPGLSAAEVVHRLTATATDAGLPGRDDSYGYGRLDLMAALTADVKPAPSATAAGEVLPSSRAAAPGGRPASWVVPVVVGGLAAVVVVGLIVLAVVVSLRRRRFG